ncbi:hypothetical protein [Kitasatospora sp. NPDC093558]|uniref:hypothetical protein n=1 Tax=Kitasatospora sp. NPDC093558 TaxID=3155201 RepID=UPI003442FC6C
MRIRRFVTAAALAATLSPLLLLTAATQAEASGPWQPTRRQQCEAAWNVNYWSGGVSFARGQWRACMAA